MSSSRFAIYIYIIIIIIMSQSQGVLKRADHLTFRILASFGLPNLSRHNIMLALGSRISCVTTSCHAIIVFGDCYYRLGRVLPFFYKKLSPLGFAHNKVHCDIPASYSSSSSSSSSSSPSSLRKGCDRCRVHFAIRSGSFRCSAFNDRPELINLIVV